MFVNSKYDATRPESLESVFCFSCPIAASVEDIGNVNQLFCSFLQMFLVGRWQNYNSGQFAGIVTKYTVRLRLCRMIFK